MPQGLSSLTARIKLPSEEWVSDRVRAALQDEDGQRASRFRRIADANFDVFGDDGAEFGQDSPRFRDCSRAIRL